MMGNAAIEAAQRAKVLLAQAVSEKMGIPVGRLHFENRRVFDLENPDEGISFADAIKEAESKFGTIGTVGSYSPPNSAGKFRGAGVGPSPTYSYSASVIEVEVDPDSGWIHIPKIWIAHDIGACINPDSVKGQIIGSVYMGLGEALMEEQVYRRLPRRLSSALVLKNPSMLEYKSPTFLEMPEIEVSLVEEPDSRGPFGAKEVGQGPLLPIMPALANAVFDAVGVRIDEVPISPEKILKALHQKEKGKDPRIGPQSFPEFSFGKTSYIAPPWEGGDGKETKTA
jgi:CO/xanthine dehydrogenase Mo-binding subunit